jgi:hypothetical protein
MKCCFQILLLLLSQFGLGQQAEKTVPASTFHAQVKATSTKDESQQVLELSQKDVRVESATGATRYFRVFAIYDSQDHLFWWVENPLWKQAPALDRTESFSQTHVIKIVPGNLVVFWSSDRPFGVQILASGAKYDSEEQGWDEVYKQLDEALYRADLLEHTARGVKTVDLGKLLGVDFTRRKEDGLSAAVHIYWPQIDSVELVNGGWKIRVENPDKNLAIVLLDKNFDVISASQIEKKTVPGNAAPPDAHKPGK